CVNRHLKGARIMPIDDWRFWIVSLLAIVTMAFATKPLFPKKSRQSRGGDGPSNTPENDGDETRASLTVGGTRVG
ncbi:MAG: hypothetical protein QMB94_11845, partial [Phycisphaerales bacterium]